MSDQNQPNQDDDIVLAGEYALGLLSDAAAASVESRLVHEPTLRGLYALWAEDFAGLTSGIAPVTPPAHVETSIKARLFGVPEPRRWFAPLGLGRVWGKVLGGAVVAAVAGVLIVSSGMFDSGPQQPEDPAYVAWIAAEDDSLQVAAAYDADHATLYLDRQAGAAHTGRALELWLIAGDTAPVSLGVLPDAAQAELAMPQELRTKLADGVLAISDEPLGGSPTGSPTGAILAVGPISAS